MAGGSRTFNKSFVSDEQSSPFYTLHCDSTPAHLCAKHCYMQIQTSSFFINNLGITIIFCSLTGDIWKTGVPVLPYITYPLSSNTGLPLDCKLPDVHQAQYQNFTVMVDPVSGLEVPVLAVTRHPKTRQWLAVGGAYLHPLTNTLSPIEVGGPIIGSNGKIYPILGVGLDSSTGKQNLSLYM